jgi:hypothetical protein
MPKHTTAEHEDSAPADSFAPEQVAASSPPTDDRPKIMRDSDLEGLMRQYNLTRPEAEGSGPHGPFANYPKAEVSPEEVAQQTGLPVELVAPREGS